MVIPFQGIAQERLKDYDLVRKDYFRVVVNGDTLEDEQFQNLYTAEQFLRGYADTVKVNPSSSYILGMNFWFRPDYEPIPEGTLQSLLLKDVNWQHSQDPDSSVYDIRVEAYSIADSVQFHYTGFDSTGLVLDIKSIQIPRDRTVRDTLTTDFNGIIQLDIEAYYGTSYTEDSLTLDMGFISSLPADFKKKDDMATDADAQAYIDAVETAAADTFPAFYDAAIDQLVQDLKAAGVWTKLLRFGIHKYSYFREGARTNLNDPSITFTEQGSVSWSNDVGYSGNGTDALVDLEFNPSTDGGSLFTLTGGSFAIRVPDGTTGLTGTHGIGNTNIRGGVGGRISAGEDNFYSPSSFAFVHKNRTNGSQVNDYIDGAFQGNRTEPAAASLENRSIGILAENRSGGRNWSSDTVEFSVVGGTVTSTEASALNAAINDYIAAIEAGGGGTISVSGSVDSLFSLSGDISQDSLLSGTLDNESGLSAATVKQAALSGSLNAEAIISGDLLKQALLSGDIQTASALSGAIVKQMALSGQLESESSLSASLVKQALLSGSIDAASVLSGNIVIVDPGITSLSGSVDTTSELSANLTLLKNLQGIVETQTAVSGDLIKEVSLSGDILTVSSLSADASIQQALSGTILVTSTLSGELTPVGAAWGGTIDITNSPLYSLSFQIKPMHNISIEDNPFYTINIKVKDE